ncbi:MAG: hypothetical protein ABTD50_10415 [Polyangiaceae bacterium]
MLPSVILGEKESVNPVVSSWWLVWMGFMFLCLAPSLAYGWGYRGWGPPYPRYFQRRRGQQAVAGGGATSKPGAWGWGGDFVWLSLFVGALWAGSALWWGW